MPSDRPSSHRQASLLVRHLVERAAFGERLEPEEVMTRLIEAIRRRRAPRDEQLHLFLRDRNVCQIEVLPSLTCDGLIEPIGSGFTDGFRMRLKKNAADVRIRFTMAHEVCHTFFYELVPEMKFIPHERNDDEERLCNWGAATLLIPASSIRRRVKKTPMCLESLDTLSAEYAVSLPTMALRLRALGLWKCQLSLWQRMSDGGFALDRLYGGKKFSWEWEDNSVLQSVWESGESVFGRTFLNHEDPLGSRRYQPITYQVRRCSNGILALWGAGMKAQSRSRVLPLFSAAQADRRRST